jgi:hypothetical protein
MFYLVMVVLFKAQSNFCYCPSCLKKRHSLKMVVESGSQILIFLHQSKTVVFETESTEIINFCGPTEQNLIFFSVFNYLKSIYLTESDLGL